MRITSRSIQHILLPLLLLTTACASEAPAELAAPVPSLVTQLVETDRAPVETEGLPAAKKAQPAGLSPDQIATLSTLKLVDDYPLYEMHYQGEYSQSRSSAAGTSQSHPVENASAQNQPVWGCSIFAALGDPDAMLFGRNFDWRFSPALLLYTDPPDGYASLSLVDIDYLFTSTQLDNLHNRPLVERKPLLRAPFMPFDGMNEHGLAIGMAAVPAGELQPDPAKPAIDSLEIMREILDHARDVGEALDIFRSYNVLMDGGPALHYLIADRSGRSVLVEFTDRMTVLANQGPWHLATNHLRAFVEPNEPSGCWRYDRIDEQLASTAGQLTSQEAIQLLEQVSQSGDSGTQWSVVYGISTGEVQVSIGRAYKRVLSFQLEMAGETQE